MLYNWIVGSLKDAQGIRKELRSLTIGFDFWGVVNHPFGIPEVGVTPTWFTLQSH